ncbi:enoyl-CoA hydratase/isomerase family protein [Acuticoccus sp. M5D2P5]|uniref:enoyl-CoA hydratase/isomerase family protein n=1 Tax=Acuticoccus kalidii TaxID=2910977 RepID=UPI001F3C10FB|nr:enoyl-CoA hydratase/isomerase family protein [Acuticoccus kalidii]MCF3933084.1 enoyl-CoA hydratase/isomerase family protein [Acuticoccus kalidii]
MSADEGVATIVLNRPDRMNAWDTPMRAAFVTALTEAGADPEIRAIIITGAGDRAFCAGQDLNEATNFEADGADAWIEDFHTLYRTVRSLEKPVIAALNGVAAGSAFQFALLTDIRVGHPGVRLGQPEINSGIASITGPWIMREVLGLSRTIELTLTGRLINAEEALAIGVLHHVVPQGEVMAKSRALAIELGAKPPGAMALIKRRFFEVLEPGLLDAVEAAKRYHHESFSSGEPQAVTRAFLTTRGGVKS